MQKMQVNKQYENEHFSKIAEDMTAVHEAWPNITE